MLSRATVIAKQIGIMLGAITAVCAAYVALGLPMPVTEAAVNARVNPLFAALNSVRVSQSQILVDLRTLQRSTLRNERFALERAAQGADAATKTALQLRIGQIEDEMLKIDARDDKSRANQVQEDLR